MEPDIEEWKRLTAQELMDKKDNIEEEIKSLHEELENVRSNSGIERTAPIYPLSNPVM